MFKCVFLKFTDEGSNNTSSLSSSSDCNFGNTALQIDGDEVTIERGEREEGEHLI